ncbi:hypothetical protein DOY81_002257, partial [Sarcophaga bullata]
MPFANKKRNKYQHTAFPLPLSQQQQQQQKQLLRNNKNTVINRTTITSIRERKSKTW